MIAKEITRRTMNLLLLLLLLLLSVLIEQVSSHGKIRLAASGKIFIRDEGIAYRDGVKEFIKEYKIGYREAIESERKNSSSENGGY